jgi:hypothetical protein
MISHNREFTSALCPATWICENGQLRRKGESYVEDVKQSSSSTLTMSSRARRRQCRTPLATSLKSKRKKDI